MAAKKPKKPKHTSLVVPGDKKAEEKPQKKDRLGREVPAPPRAAAPAEEKAEAAHAPEGPPRRHEAPAVPVPPMADAADETPKEEKPKEKKRFSFSLFGGKDKKKQEEEEDPLAILRRDEEDYPEEEEEGGALPPNAIRLPKKRPKPPKRTLSPTKRRRRRRRIQLMVVLVLVASALLFFSTGAHLVLVSLAGDLYDTIKIAARPGDGFPMDFAMPGFVKAEAMGGNGFVALGSREAAIVSSTGVELRRVQHAYLTPGLSAGDTRAVLYYRAGKEYTVESRSKTLAKVATDQDILFCEMSPGGWLAVCTTSRFSSRLSLYSPTYDTANPELVFKTSDVIPITASFYSDNRTLAVGCISARGGALASTIYLLRAGRDTPLATIEEDAACLLRLEYLSSGRILAVFDEFAALYNSKGEEVARYAYDGRRLVTADMAGNSLALVFGTTSQNKVHTVMLNNTLEPRFEVATEVSGTPQVLVADGALFLLAGQELFAYTDAGAAGETLQLLAKPYTVVYGGQPLLLETGQARALAALLEVTTDTPSSASLPPGGSSQPPVSDGSDPSGSDISGPDDESGSAPGAA